MKKKVLGTLLIVATLLIGIMVGSLTSGIAYGESSSNRLKVKSDTTKGITEFYIVTDKETKCQFIYTSKSRASTMTPIKGTCKIEKEGN